MLSRETVARSRGVHNLEELIEKDRIVDTLIEPFVATDRRDWTAVKATFAPQVIFDMSSLTGVPAASMPAEQIAAAWEHGLRPLKAVYHQAGNFRTRIAGTTVRRKKISRACRSGPGSFVATSEAGCHYGRRRCLGVVPDAVES